MSLTSAHPGTSESPDRAPVQTGADQTSGLAALWRSVLPTEAEIRSARRRLHLKAAFIAALVAASYGALVIDESSLLLRFASAAVLVTGLIATATSIMHDANHGAFSRSQRLDRVVSYVADGLGTSSFMWRFKHNVLHHGATNVEGIDSDIDQPPFARLSPGQPWRRWHRYQHIYLWPLYGFMALKNLLIGDLRNVITGRIGPQEMRHRPAPADIARIVAGKVAHIAVFVVIPLLFNPWWAVLAFYVAMSWVVGFVLAVTFQLAHCVDETDAVDESESHRGAAFAPHQLRTTANIASPVPVAGHLFRWIVGGLDHQIEHHLAPRLPHTIYPSLGRRFRAQCLEHGFDHKRHRGVWAAIGSHARWLHQMGRPIPPPS
ncbi:MAG: fatty acid desaturase family protein [Acidimicrobiales bacterium]